MLFLSLPQNHPIILDIDITELDLSKSLYLPGAWLFKRLDARIWINSFCAQNTSKIKRFISLGVQNLGTDNDLWMDCVLSENGKVKVGVI